MKIGKIPENVLKRSVLKQFQIKRPEVVKGAAVGEDCTALAIGEDEVFVLSTDPITGTKEDIGKLSILITLNDIASSGAEPVGVLVTMLLPPETEEPDIKVMIRQIEAECERFHVQVIGGHTEITKVVKQPVISVTGVGKVKRDALVVTGGIEPGDDIIITKWIALEGTSILAKEKEAELAARFPQDLIDTAKNFDRYLSIVPEAAAAVKSGVHSMRDVTEGGIFGALWEVAEASGVGLEIDLKKIPIRQESVEICEFFGINPYELISSGSLLMAAPDGVSLVRRLEEEQIPAVIVGKAVAGNDRVLCRDGERRFLEPPKTDEIYKVV